MANRIPLLPPLSTDHWQCSGVTRRSDDGGPTFTVVL
jgi:hypothetical protein